jgi:cholesterol transport system auxiliary component
MSDVPVSRTAVLAQAASLARRLVAASLFVGAALSLAACGSTPTPTYNLSAPGGFTAGGSGNGQLVVVAPTALAVLNTDKIMVEPGAGQVAYLADAQWSDNLPALLHARTIQAFENASKLRRVARPGDGVNADYTLVTDIRTFALRITDQGPVAVVEISAKLIGTQSGRILAAQVFRAAVPAASSAGPAATAALDQAQEQVLVQMVRWASTKF